MRSHTYSSSIMWLLEHSMWLLDCSVEVRLGIQVFLFKYLLMRTFCVTLIIVHICPLIWHIQLLRVFKLSMTSSRLTLSFASDGLGMRASSLVVREGSFGRSVETSFACVSGGELAFGSRACISFCGGSC